MKVNIIFADRTQKKFECDDIVYNERMGAFVLVTKHNGALNKTIIRSKQIRYFEFCGKDPIEDVSQVLKSWSNATVIDRAAHALKPYLGDYFKEHGVSNWDSMNDRKQYCIAFCHAIENSLFDYLDDLEDFNS